MLKAHLRIALLFALLPLFAACQQKSSEEASQRNSEQPVAVVEKGGEEASQRTGAAPVAAVDSERLVAADSEPGNWMSYGRTYSEQRHSSLKQVNDANVENLGLACWNAVVREGALKENGMAAFGQWLDEAQAEAIRDYIIQQARRARPCNSRREHRI